VALRANIDWKSAISFRHGHFVPKFQVEGVAPTNHSFFLRKLRLNDLSYGVTRSSSGDEIAHVYCFTTTFYTVFQKKTSTHIIGYKLSNSCPILIIFDMKIPHII